MARTSCLNNVHCKLLYDEYTLQPFCTSLHEYNRIVSKYCYWDVFHDFAFYTFVIFHCPNFHYTYVYVRIDRSLLDMCCVCQTSVRTTAVNGYDKVLLFITISLYHKVQCTPLAHRSTIFPKRNFTTLTLTVAKVHLLSTSMLVPFSGLHLNESPLHWA